MVGQAGGDLRVERVPGTIAGQTHDAFLTSEQALEGSVHREMDDPHRQRDLVAFRAAERAMAVPALEPVDEEVSHRPWKTQPVGEHPGHLARGREVRAHLPRHLRQSAGELARAHQPPALRVGKRADEPGQDLAS